MQYTVATNVTFILKFQFSFQTMNGFFTIANTTKPTVQYLRTITTDFSSGFRSLLYTAEVVVL